MALALALNEEGDDKSANAVLSSIEPPEDLHRTVETLRVQVKGKGSVQEAQAAWKAGDMLRGIQLLRGLETIQISSPLEALSTDLLSVESLSPDQLVALCELANLASQRRLWSIANSILSKLPKGPHRADLEIQLCFARARLKVGEPSADASRAWLVARRVEAVKDVVKGT